MTGAVAYVLDHTNGRQKELWDGFLEFDRLIEDKGVKAADFGKKLLDEISRALPSVVYIDGRFRSPFTLSSTDPSKELILPLTINIFQKNEDFNLDSLCEAISSEYHEQDKDSRLVNIDAHTKVFLYLSFRNSPLLRSTCFVESRLGVTIVREVDRYLCFYDSSGNFPGILDEYVERLKVDEMRRLFTKKKGTYLTAVSLRNSNMGLKAIRSRTISAARLYDTVPSFDDHLFVCQTAVGYSGNDENQPIRRYVGFQRGKITDSSDSRATFQDYMQWLDNITQLINGNPSSLPEFQRYAKPALLPSDPKPINILLDVAEVEDLFLTNDYHGVSAMSPMMIDNTCAEVKEGVFSISANGIQVGASIEFNQTTQRYHINSPDLERLYYSTNLSSTRDLVSYLNQNQSFQVIPKSEGSFYAVGQFYNPLIKFGRSYNDQQFGLIDILNSCDCVERIGSEKGSKCMADGSGWDTDSLFAIIDKQGVGYGIETLFGNPEIIVCDDLGTEIADFILAYKTERRVVFIHAKGIGNQVASRKYAASPLQEVCGQAMKNLRYLSKFGQDTPPNASDWYTKKWIRAKGVSGEVTRRIRKKPDSVTTGLQLWKEIKGIIRDPYANLEVWLFLGRMLSKDALSRQLMSANPAAEAKQTAYLLFSAMTNVYAVGAHLRVICSP